MKKIINANVEDSLSNVLQVVDQVKSLNDMISELDQPGLDYLESLCPGFTSDGLSLLSNLINR